MAIYVLTIIIDMPTSEYYASLFMSCEARFYSHDKPAIICQYIRWALPLFSAERFVSVRCPNRCRHVLADVE